MSAPNSVEFSFGRYCGNCGYALGGLPESGVCPECGGAYNADEIVLFGWGTGNSANLVNARVATINWFICINAFFVLCFGATRLSLWTAIAISVVILALSFYRRFSVKGMFEAPAQVRLEPHGYGMRVGVGQISLRPWKKNLLISNKHQRSGRYRLTLQEPNRALPFRGGQISGVGFEFECNEKDAQFIRDCCRAWRDAGAA